jgi:hypothetical protein
VSPASLPGSTSRAFFSQIDRLNITAASRIHILEPQWNPSLERQAIGRAVRLGQTKQVKVMRYITAGSIEEVSLVHTRLENLILIFWEAYSSSTTGKASIIQNWIYCSRTKPRSAQGKGFTSTFNCSLIDYITPKLTFIAGAERISIANYIRCAMTVKEYL